MARHNPRARALLTFGVIAVSVVSMGCGKAESPGAGTPRVEEKVVTLSVKDTPTQVAFLTARLAEARVVHRVETQTEQTVDPPKLLATLTLKNTSTDQSARLVAGRIEYLDAGGGVIPLVPGRGEATFTFYSYGDRIDPGKDISQSIDVPFPVSALKERALADVRVHVTYVPTPYRTESATLRVSLGDRR